MTILVCTCLFVTVEFKKLLIVHIFIVGKIFVKYVLSHRLLSGYKVSKLTYCQAVSVT